MEITLLRKTKTTKSTIGELSIDGKFECFVLEDIDRGLTQNMTKSQLNSLKKHGQTCVPTGRYEIAITFSNRFQKFLPLLLNVPAFEGIRIHSGNKPEDTEGCLLPGTTQATDLVENSRIAFSSLFSKLKTATKTQKIFITIQ